MQMMIASLLLGYVISRYSFIYNSFTLLRNKLGRIVDQHAFAKASKLKYSYYQEIMQSGHRKLPLIP